MKRFNDSKISMVLFVFVAAIVLGGSVKADFTFGSFTKLEFPGPDTILCFSYDGLEMYISAERPEGYGGGDLWVCKRASQDEDWGPAENLGEAVNSPSQEYSASISADGLALYFESNRPGSSGWDIYMTTRATKNDPWSTAVALPSAINTISAGEPWISPDGLELYFNGYGYGGFGNSDIWVTRRATEKDPWDAPVNLGATVNGVYDDHYLSLSPDGLLLFFCEYFSLEGPFRPDTYGLGDIWMTRRASLSAPWQVPVNLGSQINSNGWDLLPRVSPDGRTLYFWNELAGNNGYWLAPILPVVDFNGDGAVDAADMRIMVEHWGTDESLFDIGPMPWGDGIVNVEDLVVLSEHLFEEVNDPTLVAHWALDETEGMFAVDCAGDNDAFVVGGAAWQPDSGQVDGALELNGIDGCAIAGSVLDPADGSFGIFAWVNGGAPGQVVVSQQGAANWLAVDGEGNLMTELKSSDQLAGPLLSETVITDGNWHRIGLLWDGSHRTLCVDGIAVAEDMQDSLTGSSNGLYIGTGKAMEPGSYFSGLIDDVRIYNRAVNP